MVSVYTRLVKLGYVNIGFRVGILVVRSNDATVVMDGERLCKLLTVEITVNELSAAVLVRILFCQLSCLERDLAL